MRRIVAGRATALAVSGVEAFRKHNEFEALQVLEHHCQFVPAALLVIVALALATPSLVKGHQLLGRRSLSPATRFKRGEYVQGRVGDIAPRRTAVVKELQLETMIIQVPLEPASDRLGEIQFQPSGVRRLYLRNFAPQQKTPGDRRAEINQHLQIAWASMIALKKESQRRVIDRDVFGVIRNRDREVQEMTVIPSFPVYA